jgi:Protein of unknown function (DUF3179)
VNGRRDASGQALALATIRRACGYAALAVACAAAAQAPSVPGRGSVPSPTASETALQDRLHVRLSALLAGHPDASNPSIAWLDANWRDEFVPYALDTVRFIPDRPSAQALLALLAKKTGQPFGNDWAAWMRWQWQRDEPPPDYAAYKASLHALIDPRFEAYFDPGRRSMVRLDEVVWGGVHQDGIPPLRAPKMLVARDAKYLADRDVVFGIEVNGDARAYPKRILAWHEMFTDRVGGIDVAGVYCTLCGAVILYETTHAGRSHRLGTSGFLYRSNKLMYDADTQSLWNTLEGRPVIGPLVGQDISLATREIVTTTWGEWKRRHPKTTVLSLDTGHRRDYDEGAAYRDYFATDAVMFPVPEQDVRLANKAEVLVPRFGRPGDKPLAIESAFLRANPVWHGRYGERDFAVLTDRSGAHRVYALPTGARVASYDGDRAVVLASGEWLRMSEPALAGPTSTLARLPAHNAFWFGWRAAHPDTLLVAAERTTR